MTCSICHGLSGHPPITDDGFDVCLPCLMRLTRAAAFPDGLSVMEAIALEEMHGDLVSIEPGTTGFVWEWKGWA